jgi:hypothetical protein
MCGWILARNLSRFFFKLSRVVSSISTMKTIVKLGIFHPRNGNRNANAKRSYNTETIEIRCWQQGIIR